MLNKIQFMAKKPDYLSLYVSLKMITSITFGSCNEVNSDPKSTHINELKHYPITTMSLFQFATLLRNGLQMHF